MCEGCGKSSFLHVVAGLEDTTEGSVTFDGLALTEPSPERSLIFQDAALYPWLTVREQNRFVSEANEDYCRRLPPDAAKIMASQAPAPASVAVVRPISAYGRAPCRSWRCTGAA